MKIVFMGTPQPAVVCLQRLLEDGHEIVAVYTQPDKRVGRGQRLSYPPVKEFAEKLRLKLFQPFKIRNSEQINLFRSHNADVVVVVAYGKILPKEFLEAFPNGAINVHFSLLPKYRGAAPVNWAIANGERFTGVTTMKMDEGLDTGDILLQQEIEILPDETAVELTDRLSILGAELLSMTLKNLDKIQPRQQDETLATYAPILKKEDGLINWNLTAREISDRVRAFQPFPTSYTYFRGKRLTIWRCRQISDDSMFTAEPGTLIHSSNKTLHVACGENTVLQIEELQPEGRKRMHASDFINGWRPSSGEKFSSEIAG